MSNIENDKLISISSHNNKFHNCLHSCKITNVGKNSKWKYISGGKKKSRASRIDFFDYLQWWLNRCSSSRTRWDLSRENGSGIAFVYVYNTCEYTYMCAVWHIGRLRHSRYSCSKPSSSHILWKPLSLEIYERESLKTSNRFSCSISNDLDDAPMSIRDPQILSVLCNTAKISRSYRVIRNQ